MSDDQPRSQSHRQGSGNLLPRRLALRRIPRRLSDSASTCRRPMNGIPVATMKTRRRRWGTSSELVNPELAIRRGYTLRRPTRREDDSEVSGSLKVDRGPCALEERNHRSFDSFRSSYAAGQNNPEVVPLSGKPCSSFLQRMTSSGYSPANNVGKSSHHSMLMCPLLSGQYVIIDLEYARETALEVTRGPWISLRLVPCI